MHQQNAAEKAITMFRNHFKFILAGVDKTFPMHLWDRLLPQTESTLNMLQPTNIAPTILAHDYMYGQHNYNKMLLAPMGCAAMIHNKPDSRQTCDDNATNGYYLETSREHCWCYKVWIKQTQSIQVTDTVYFKHQYVTIPTYAKADAIVSASKELIRVLQHYALANIRQTKKE